MHNNTIKDLQPEYRPDEKFLAYGPKALTDSELLAIILRTGNPEEHSVDLARKILTPVGDDDISILNIFNYEYHELLKIKGIGKVKALQIKAIAELSLRISQGSARSRLTFDDPGSVAEYYMEQLRHEKREKVVLLMLNSAYGLIKEYMLSTGTVNMSVFSARELFIAALRYEAVCMILIHNHPSGMPDPSLDDIRFTREICDLGCKLGIPLKDHIIIGDKDYYSFKEGGLIDE